MKKVYGFNKQVSYSHEEAIEKVTAALKTQGFGVLTTVDFQATLKAKLDADTRPYVMLGACKPSLAYKASTLELEIGLLLPCNAIIYVDDNGNTIVSVIDPQVMLGVVDNPRLDKIASEASVGLQNALAVL